jgi:hypothetical protein
MIQTGLKPTIYRTRDQNGIQTHNLPHLRSEQGSNPQSTALKIRTGIKPQSTALEIRTGLKLTIYRTRDQNANRFTNDEVT